MLKKKFKEAFTLVELIVVLAIIGVLAGVSVGAYFGITTKAKKTAALAEANMIRTQLYAIATQSGGFKSGQLSNNGVQFPDNIEYFTADLLSSYTSGMRKANGGASGPSIEFNFYSDAYQTEVDSSLNDYVRLGIGYLLAASAGSINTATINKYASEVYVSTTDGTISSFDVVKDGMWVSTSVSQPATDLVGSTPTVIDVRVSPTKPTSGTDTSLAAWTNWYASDKYTRYLSRYKSVDETKDGQTKAFMKASAYRVGNQNALDLGPHVEALLNGNPISLADLSGGASSHDAVTYKVTEAGVDKTSTYLDVAAADPAAKGLVKFTAAAAGKNVVLTFTYGNGTNANFPNISYNISVVDGLNVTDAKTFFALNNDTGWYGVEGADASLTRTTSITTKIGVSALGNYNAGVFQSDLTLNKDDIPSYFIWQSGEKTEKGDDIDASVVGSLKDESYFVQHRHSIAHPTFDIYGNYFKLSLGSDLPKIASGTFYDGGSTPNGKAPASGTPVESHAAVFSDKQEQYLNIVATHTSSDVATVKAYYETFKTNFYDLSSTGNHGVSNVADTTNAGLSFYKAFDDAEVNNCVFNSYYIPVMDNGRFNVSSGADAGLQPTVDIKNCRLTDSGNVAIFLYTEGTINVTNSEVRNAGGPLTIAYSARFSAADLATGFSHGSWINFTGCTMENKVTGAGGWFSINVGAESLVLALKNIDPKMRALGKTFVYSGTGSNTYLNMLGLVMCDRPSNTNPLTIKGGINIDAVQYVDNTAEADKSAAFGTNNANNSNVIKVIKGTESLFAKVSDTGSELVDLSGNSLTAGYFGNKTTDQSKPYVTIYKGLWQSFAGTIAQYPGTDAYGILMTLSDYTA